MLGARERESNIFPAARTDRRGANKQNANSMIASKTGAPPTAGR